MYNELWKQTVDEKKNTFPSHKKTQTQEIQSKHTFILLWKIFSFTQDNTIQNPLKIPSYTFGGGGLRLTMIRYNINTLWHSFMTHENSKESEEHNWSDMIANLSQSSIAGNACVESLLYSTGILEKPFPHRDSKSSHRLKSHPLHRRPAVVM